MSDVTETSNPQESKVSYKRRNIILGIVLACASLFMYASIFVRLSHNPLS